MGSDLLLRGEETEILKGHTESPGSSRPGTHTIAQQSLDLNETPTVLPSCTLGLQNRTLMYMRSELSENSGNHPHRTL